MGTIHCEDCKMEIFYRRQGFVFFYRKYYHIQCFPVLFFLLPFGIISRPIISRPEEVRHESAKEMSVLRKIYEKGGKLLQLLAPVHSHLKK